MPKGVRSYESCLGVTHVGKTLLEQEVWQCATEPRAMVILSGSGASRVDLKKHTSTPMSHVILGELLAPVLQVPHLQDQGGWGKMKQAM